MLHYPPEPWPGESRIDWEQRALNPWRNEIKRHLLAERGWACEREGCERPAEHLDEAIIPRCDMRGLSVEQRWLAFCEVNLAVLCAECNTASAHDRDGAWDRACSRYGEQTMKTWYASLGLKAPRKDWVP